jgi:DNA-binding GntR family transcriptional regulator
LRRDVAQPILSAHQPGSDMPPRKDAALSTVEAGPAERVRLRLLQAVLEHRLPPGAKLKEEEVAAACGVGRTVVRAALLSLSHDGVVRIERNRGAFVASPDPREAREVLEARALLEPATARAAAARMTAADAERLTAHSEAENAALAAGDLGRAAHLSGRFHDAIADIAGQRTVATIIRGLTARSALIVALYWRRRDVLCERHAHAALLDALRCGDGDEAEALMKSHLADLLSGLDLRPAKRDAPDIASALGTTP